ncbi:Fatty acid desaturase [Roseobacter denitrificans OCh 114]|uniref:Beta-carotene ketolase, putative n=1 Tax=Roseobacter denitrificans (strain ATCC 33942 / OCh 114) TaxID=375451 RepID=Q16CV8_ROSDO|nr:beta-carotene ketolase, putative [Roseobacter denitrificans OCh 114]SFF70403.1 Fatty acid desaturase [Roseobacter denitrificans OCh 114]
MRKHALVRTRGFSKDIPQISENLCCERAVVTPRKTHVQWPTLLVCLCCYGGVAGSTLYAEILGPVLAGLVLTLSLTLFSSFNHEVLHGHPFRSRHANTALVFPAMGLVIPYMRFRDTHLAHHHDPSLTDPYDDPESNYVDPAVWCRWSVARRRVYAWNNTLLGRMLIGPIIGLLTFYEGDARRIRQGDRDVIRAYLFHFAGLIPVVFWLVWMSEMPFWLYAIAVYASLAILKIRTFLEHQAHEKARCRSVIIEDRGPLSVLFLKNNLHAVHHAHPTLPWYRLQGFYDKRRAVVLTRNGGYVYRSYMQIAGLFLLKAKDPVPHSQWSSGHEQVPQPQKPQKTTAARDITACNLTG